jgi:hypothetical protein
VDHAVARGIGTAGTDEDHGHRDSSDEGGA